MTDDGYYRYLIAKGDARALLGEAGLLIFTEQPLPPTLRAWLVGVLGHGGSGQSLDKLLGHVRKGRPPERFGLFKELYAAQMVEKIMRRDQLSQIEAARVAAVEHIQLSESRLVTLHNTHRDKVTTLSDIELDDRIENSLLLLHSLGSAN